MALSRMVGFDVTPRMPSSETSFAKPAAGEQRAGEVVVPGALAEVVEAGDRAGHRVSPVVRAAQRARRRDVLGGEAELFEHDLTGRRRTEVVDADDVVGVALPAEASRPPRPRASARRRAAPSRGSSSAARRRGPTTGIDTTRTDESVGSERRAAPTHTDTSDPVPIEHEVEARRRLRRPACTRRWARRRPRARAVPSRTGIFWRVRRSAVGPGAVDVDPPRLRDLVGVGGSDHAQAGHRPHRRELLDRLVRRAVLAETRPSRGSTRTASLYCESAASRTAGRM